MKRKRRLTKRERKALPPDGGSFTDRFLFELYGGGGKTTELEYLMMRMSPFVERSEMWRRDGAVYGWYGMACPGSLDQYDNANAYSPEGPEDMD